MKRRVVALLVVIAAAWLVGAQVSAGASGVARRTKACSPWIQVPVPDPPQSKGFASLYGIASLTGTEGWAVGYVVAADGTHTLIEHWDGTQWAIAQAPKGPGYQTNWLNDVAGVAPNDVWAVGRSTDSYNSQWPLIEHWDGSAWSVASDRSFTGIELTSVVAVAADDVWAAGSFSHQPLLYHWDGASWHYVPAPPTPSFGHLNGLDATAGNDVWAVGYDTQTSWQTLVLHYDGTSWSVVPSPTPGDRAVFNDVVAVSSTEAWAVGYTGDGSQTTALAERWDGTAWSVVPGVPTQGALTWLAGAARVPGGFVAIGGTYASDAVRNRPWVVRWNGTTWKRERTPNPGTPMSQLYGVATRPSGKAWAVGSFGDANENAPLAFSGCP